MSEPTTDEMIAWCHEMRARLASRLDDIQTGGGRIGDIEETEDHIHMLSAIIARLRRSAAKS